MKINKEVKVGLLVTFSLTIAYLGFNFLKGKEVFSSNNRYYTVYASCRGLGVSSSVLLNGVPVGKVINLKVMPNQEHSVLVTFETKQDIKLTDTTKAQLISPSFLGNRAIELIIEKGNLLKNYGTVIGQVEQGFGDSLLGGAVPALQDIQNISSLASQFVTSLIENTSKINSIFANIEDTTEQLKKTISSSQHEFHDISHSMSAVASALADEHDGLVPLLKRLNQLTKNIKGEDVAGLVAKFDSVLRGTCGVLEKIGHENSSFGQLFADNALYNNLNQTLDSLDKLLIDLRTHPWRYINISVFGKKQIHEPAQQE